MRYDDAYPLDTLPELGTPEGLEAILSLVNRCYACLRLVRRNSGGGSGGGRLIVVEVNLRSALDPNRDRLLGRMVIWNHGKKSRETSGRIGDYAASLSKWEPKQHEPWRCVSVLGFARKSRGPWDLIFRVLCAAVADRNPCRTGQNARRPAAQLDIRTLEHFAGLDQAHEETDL